MAGKVVSKGSTLEEEVINVLIYWFGTAYWNKRIGTFAYYDELWKKKWFANGADEAEADAYIKEHFTNTLQLAMQGKFTETWCEDHHSCLALIIVLDQFTRHVYRGSARMWSGDKLALQICLEAIDKGMDKKLSIITRTWHYCGCQFYMPLIHAEDMEIQEKALSLYKEIVQESQTSMVEICKGFLKVCNRNYDTISTFGRYPQRNKLLNRPSTAQEMAYLSA